MKPSTDQHETWKERHKLYVDDARERIGRARTNLMLMIAALVTLWLGGIEVKVVEFGELYGISKTKAAAVAEGEKIGKASNTKEPGLSGTTSLRPSPSKEEKVRNERESAAKELKDRLKKGVGFKLFGFEFPVPPVLAPSIWLALLVMMLGYMTLVRGAVFHSLRIASRIEKEHLQSDLRERLLNVPWWMSPIPAEFVAEDEPRFDLIMGWRSKPPRCTRSALVTAGVIFASVGLVLAANAFLLAICSDETFRRMTNDLHVEDWHLTTASLAPWTAAWIGVLLICSWWWQMQSLRKVQIPSMSAGCCDPGRRRFLQGLFPAGLSLIACGTLPFLSGLQCRSIGNSRRRSNLLAKLRRIRKRRSTPVPNIKPLTGYAGSASKVIHMSTNIRSFRFPKLPDTKPGESLPQASLAFASFQPASDSKGERIALAESSWALEQIALNMVNQDAADASLQQACDVLLCLVRHDILLVANSGKHPNYRAFDLLAGLSVRSKSDHLERLIAIIKSSPLESEFTNRLDKWQETDPTKSRWLRRWAGTNTSKRKAWATSIARGASTQNKKLRIELSA